MARRFARTFVRPAPKTKLWIGVLLGQTTLAASTKVLVGSFSASALGLRPFTILRTHLECHYETDQVATSEAPFGIMGWGIFNDTAVSLGVTALPSPSGSPEQDWYVYQAMSSSFVFGDATGFGTVGKGYIIDSKAMRKVGLDDDQAVMFTQTASVGADLTIQGRQLIQLH